MIIMCLVVLVPLITSVNPIVVLRLAGAVLLVPPVHARLHLHFPSKGCISILVNVAHGPLSKGPELPCLVVIPLQQGLQGSKDPGTSSDVAV